MCRKFAQPGRRGTSSECSFEFHQRNVATWTVLVRGTGGVAATGVRVGVGAAGAVAAPHFEQNAEFPASWPPQDWQNIRAPFYVSASSTVVPAEANGRSFRFGISKAPSIALTLARESVSWQGERLFGPRLRPVRPQRREALGAR